MDKLHKYEQQLQDLALSTGGLKSTPAQFDKLRTKLEELRWEGREAGRKLSEISTKTSEMQGQLEDMCVEINGGHDFEDGVCVECLAVDDYEPELDRYEDLAF